MCKHEKSKVEMRNLLKKDNLLEKKEKKVEVNESREDQEEHF